MQGFTSHIGYSEWSRKDEFKVEENECIEIIYDAILIVQEREVRLLSGMVTVGLGSFIQQTPLASGRQQQGPRVVVLLGG